MFRHDAFHDRRKWRSDPLMVVNGIKHSLFSFSTYWVDYRQALDISVMRP